VRARAVRLVLEHQSDYSSQWAAICSIASKIGCAGETLHLYAEPPFGPDAEAIPGQQHSDHALRIDGRPPRRAVKGREGPADTREIDEPVRRPQQMTRANVILKRKFIKQSALRLLPRTHHRHHPPQ